MGIVVILIEWKEIMQFFFYAAFYVKSVSDFPDIKALIRKYVIT